MSPNDTILWGFSAIFILVMSVLLVTPIVQRKTDVFTSWNLFLIGAIMFTGLSGFNAAKQGHYLPSYRATDYYMYYAGTLLFYAASFFGYYVWKFPRRFAGRHLLAWPKLSGGVLVALTIILSLMGIFQRVQVPVPLVGQLLFQFGVASPLLSFACAFIAWYRSPRNIMLVALLVGVGVMTLLMVLGVGGSRRYLMAVLAVVPISLYWIWLRYKPTTTIVVWLLVALFVGVPVIKGFSAIRHHMGSAGLSPTERAIRVVQALPKAIVSGGSSEGFMGQDSVESAILAIHMLNDNSERITVSHFHSLIYIFTNPVPRQLWEGKPVGFGSILPVAAGLPKRGINANLGVNVAGQCFYDGGLHTHILYGLIFAAFLRFYDELLVRQAGNPILIGGLVFMAPQLIAFPRGGVETMGLQIILGFAVVVMTGWIARMVFGSGLVYPRTDHMVHYPSMRSPNDWAIWMSSYTAVAASAKQIGDQQHDEEEYP